MNKIWVVFDGVEPDSAILGCAHTVHGVLNAIKTTGSLDKIHVHIQGKKQDVLEITAIITSYMAGDSQSYTGKWLALQRYIYDG